MIRAELTHRTNNFDFVRIFAALCVLVSHHFALSGLPEPLVLQFQTLGGYGVFIFFSISGFLVAQSWERDPNLLRFASRRLLRIWPGMLCALVLCALILGPIVTTLPLREYFSNDLTWKYFATLLFQVQPFLQGVFPNSPVPYIPNGVLWTIPIEVHCYGYLALLGLIGVLRFRWLLLLLTTALAFYYYVYHDAEAVFKAGGGRIHEIEFATFFFSGALLHYFRGIWLNWGRALVTFLIISICSLFLIKYNHQLIAAFLLTPFTFVVMGNASFPVVRRFGRFGDMSYGIYIYAFPVQQTLIWALGKSISFSGSLILALSITSALAWISWHFIEQPALKLKPKASKSV
ncbi:acyltransferase [uncultured Xanthomonas sp.]|uniref:acyltransferase family protein n=1 Tax=uncultured Xanthomonas sp. TaxID=152831 RepID=UPI0025ECD7BC|nr:acyltransferase [uncultured Xanthomonas sp.]